MTHDMNAAEAANGNARPSSAFDVLFRPLVRHACRLGPRVVGEILLRLVPDRGALLRELRRYIDRKERTGGDTTRELVDLNLKIAYPFANLVIVLFGVTLAGRSARRGGAALGFGLALFLCIVFWMSIKFGQGVGYGGGLPPWLAAWLANIVFGALGLMLLLRARS